MPTSSYPICRRPNFLDLKGDCTRMRHANSSGFSATKTDNAAKDDVVIVSSKDNESSTLWVNYLAACFEQISRQQGRPPFRVSQISFEDSINPCTELNLRNARLQIIVVCPVFLDRVTERPEQATAISRQLNSTRLLAMMLGVQDAHLNEIHRTSLISYPHWKKFFVKDQDETFVGQLLGAAVAILGNSANTTASANGQRVDKEGFSVHPKKVKLGQNRIIVLLNDPLKAEDEISVVVDKCGEGIEVTNVKRRNPYALQFSIPERCLEVSMIVGVKIVKNGYSLGARQVKCESRLRELDQILRAHDNPLEFMCQTFGFHTSDREQLDSWMVHAFQKNVPPHFNLLSRPMDEFPHSRNTISSEEYPTLLHFSARFGLEKLAWQLLECPGVDVACDMRNINDLTPADLAEQSGHIKLAHQLRGYMQMNEFTNMYSYLKVMSEKSNGNKAPSTTQLIERSRAIHNQPSGVTTEEPREDYCRPRPLNEAYSVPPTTIRPINVPTPDYSLPPPRRNEYSFSSIEQQRGMGSSSTSLTNEASLKSHRGKLYNTGDLELPFQGYMQMSPAGQRKTDNRQPSSPLQLAVSQESITNATENSRQHGGCGSDSTSDRSSTKSRSLGRSSSASTKSTAAADDELVEIINDFKNKVHSITEIEHLVEAWKNRDDVKQSFKDKQRQLSAMREEYERIQKTMKAEIKGPSPIDRIKNFFKGKKESKESSKQRNGSISSKKSNHSSNTINNPSERRPVSSLSFHSVSSSSSGRMSTVSGCSRASLGDSGTHSDTDDRRQHQRASSAEKTGMTNYEIPPAPKPFQNRFSPAKFAPTALLTNGELDLPSVKSSHPTADDKEYYIEFPPSGLPVHAFHPRSPLAHSDSHDVPDFATLVDEIDLPDRIIEEEQLEDQDLAINTPPNLVSDYVNIQPWDDADAIKTEGNVLTIKPEIHAEPRNVSMDLVPEEEEEPKSIESKPEIVDEILKEVPRNEYEFRNEIEIPIVEKIEDSEVVEKRNFRTVPDGPTSTSVDEIARNFGVTLKKSSGTVVPPKTEFNFVNNSNASKE